MLGRFAVLPIPGSTVNLLCCNDMKISPQLADLVLARLNAQVDATRSALAVRRRAVGRSDVELATLILAERDAEAYGFRTACALLIDEEQWRGIERKARKVETP